MPVEYGTRCPAGHWLVALSKRAADRRKREAKEKARKAEREKKLPKTIKSIRNRNVLPDPENEWPASTQYLRYKFRKATLRARNNKASTGLTFTLEGFPRQDFANIFGHFEVQRDDYLLQEMGWIVPDYRSA